MPVDEYLRLTEKPYREYRDGASLPRQSPQFHSLIQYALLALLRALGAQAFPELTVRISRTRYLVPDVAVADDFPGPYPTEPVRLCCEILSPEDNLGATLANCEEYHAWGVQHCWVIDPVKRTAWEYHAAGEPVRVGAVLQAGSLSIGLAELFAFLDNGA